MHSNKRQVISLEEKIKIIKEFESANCTQRALASKFGISQQCVSFTLRKKNEILNKYFSAPSAPVLALEDKIKIIKESERPFVTQGEVAIKFGITQQSVSRILQKKDKYMGKYME